MYVTGEFFSIVQMFLLSLTFIVKFDSAKNKWTIQVQLLRCFGSATQGTRPFQDHRSTAVVAGLGQLGLKKIDKIIKYHNSKQDKYCSVCPTKYAQRTERKLREICGCSLKMNYEDWVTDRRCHSLSSWRWRSQKPE